MLRVLAAEDVGELPLGVMFFLPSAAVDAAGSRASFFFAGFNAFGGGGGGGAAFFASGRGRMTRGGAFCFLVSAGGVSARGRAGAAPSALWSCSGSRTCVGDGPDRGALPLAAAMLRITAGSFFFGGDVGFLLMLVDDRAGGCSVAGLARCGDVE